MDNNIFGALIYLAVAAFLHQAFPPESNPSKVKREDK